MAETIKGTMKDAGHKVSEMATKAGQKVSESVTEATDWVKEKAHQASHPVDEVAEKMENRTGTPMTGNECSGSAGTAGAAIREHMVVEASCGTRIGKVDHVEGDSIKLTKNDSPDGMHHRIPMAWVTRVDDCVHLNKDHKEVQAQWQSA
jgi:hypothetical protein